MSVLNTGTLVAIICAFFVIFIVFWINKRNKTYWQLRDFISPPGLPLLRHFFIFTKDSTLLQSCLDLARGYGGLLKLEVLYGLNFTLVTDYDFIKFLLGTTTILNKTKDYAFLSKWLGTGLLTSEREKWQKTRRLINPAFHVQLLESYVNIFNGAADVLISKLKPELENESVDIYPYMTLCTLDVICESIMGTKVNAQENRYSEYVKSVKEMCRIIMHRSQSPFKRFNLIYFFSRDYWKERKAVRYLYNFTNTVIQNKKSELRARKENVSEAENTTKRKLSFLDLVMEGTIDGRPLTDEEVRQEVDTFTFAGHDTTASGISFTLYCLATNPDAQEKVFQELQLIFEDDKNKPATYKDLQEMKYLDLVIKESLRLFPPVPIYGRAAAKDTAYGNNLLQEQLSISVFAYGVHRNPVYFPEPEKFIPERFETMDSIPTYAYLPFSAGPRSCIGQRFATLEMKVVISKILRKFELLPVPNFTPKLVAWTVLRSTNGILINFKERV